jgi:hypothetical protein
LTNFDEELFTERNCKSFGWHLQEHAAISDLTGMTHNRSTLHLNELTHINGHRDFVLQSSERISIIGRGFGVKVSPTKLLHHFCDARAIHG